MIKRRRRGGISLKKKENIHLIVAGACPRFFHKGRFLF